MLFWMVYGRESSVVECSRKPLDILWTLGLAIRGCTVVSSDSQGLIRK